MGFPLPYLVNTTQGCIASQETMHSETRNDCIVPITCAIIKTTKEEPSTCSWR